jgi:hypothetical protein
VDASTLSMTKEILKMRDKYDSEKTVYTKPKFHNKHDVTPLSPLLRTQGARVPNVDPITGHPDILVIFSYARFLNINSRPSFRGIKHAQIIGVVKRTVYISPELYRLT